MSDKLAGFLREGLTRYPEAFNTVRLFEQTLKEQIVDLLESKDDWTTFAFPNGEKVIKTFANGRAGEGIWICALATGLLNGTEEARIETGLWWSPPKLKVPAIVYASFYEQPAKLCRFKGTSADPRIRFADLMRYTRLYVEPSPDFEVSADLDLVLAELQRHAGGGAT